MSSALPTVSRVPAEWEPQEAVWLAWPHNRETWPDTSHSKYSRYDRIPSLFAVFAKLIAESTPVRVLASQHVARDCEAMLQGESSIEVIDIPTNDCWIRDYGPSFVLDPSGNSMHGVSWQYNAWGGKYPPWDLDNAAAKKMCDQVSMPCHKRNLCLEGGALEFDGNGRMLTTPNCLISETRSPDWTKTQISQELHRQLGVTEIVWIDGGALEGDDTDGHIDQIARFIDRENVVAAVCDPSVASDDANEHSLEQNYRQLRLWGDSTSPNVHVHRLPIPPPRSIGGRRVPESYCNFLRLGADRLLVPTFAAPTDDHAVGLLREISGAEVTAVDCQDLIWGLGALHCASRDQPALVG